MKKGSITFDRIADRYEETRGGLDRGKRAASYLWPHLRTARPVLEVGVGTGVVAWAMEREGFAVTGVDLSHAMAVRARARIEAVTLADAARLPLATASFEQAYTSWCLHLVGDPAAVLAEIARVLRPSARYIDLPGSDAEPNVVNDAIADMEEALREMKWSAARNAKGVASLAEAAGFRVIEQGTCPPITYLSRPSTTIERIEDRAYSYLWDLDQATWDAHVEPALERLRALPDDPVERTFRDRFVVMQRI